MADECRQSPIPTILERVASATGSDVTDLDPLYDAIDPTALRALCVHGFEGSVTFRYEGRTVTVTGDGTISVEPEDDRDETRGDE
ncbi:HalOD1 output domain-containing protein [Halovivax sp.]|uniref:HalOD1 output domain-containing protein n=1 Tax=Halovivax sp. TaxID=1935978 RepID=UPI0025C2EC16|nr:HalOD1 output domain-containing protein [Halovivax sp.]